MSTVVAAVASRVEAELIAGMLRSHGLKASVSGDDAGGMQVLLQAEAFRVLVPDAEADEARQLLDLAGPRRSESTKPSAFERWIVRVLGGQKSA